MAAQHHHPLRDYGPPQTRRQIKRQAQRQAALPPPRDYPEREPEPWKPLG